MTPELVVFAVLLAAHLIAISVIDGRQHRIPDALNLGLAVTGIGLQVRTNIEFLPYQALFATAVGLIFLTVRQAHFGLTGIIGLGLGDVKMAAAGAIWFAPEMFPLFLFMASFSALGFALIGCVRGRATDRRQKIPFGPFLAFGIAMAFGLENFWS